VKTATIGEPRNPPGEVELHRREETSVKTRRKSPRRVMNLIDWTETTKNEMLPR